MQRNIKDSAPRSESIGAGASEPEIEITPAMIEAGAFEVASYDPEATNAANTAVDVFRAMLLAARQANGESPTSGRAVCVGAVHARDPAQSK